MLNIKLKTNKKSKFYEYCYQNSINIYNIKEDKEYIDILVNEEDYKELKKIWYIKIINLYIELVTFLIITGD